MPDRPPGGGVGSGLPQITVTGSRPAPLPITLPGAPGTGGPRGPGIIRDRVPRTPPAVAPTPTPNTQPVADEELVTVLVQAQSGAQPAPKLPPQKRPRPPRRTRPPPKRRRPDDPRRRTPARVPGKEPWWWPKLPKMPWWRSPLTAAAGVTATIMGGMENAIQDRVARAAAETGATPPGTTDLRVPIQLAPIDPFAEPVGRVSTVQPLAEITVTGQRSPALQLAPLPLTLPMPLSGVSLRPTPRPAPRAQPAPLPAPRIQPLPQPQPQPRLQPLPRPDLGPLRFGTPLGPANRPLTDVGTVTLPFAQPVPKEELDRCNCPPKKKRKQSKERTECWQGTYRELRRGLIKRRRVRIPC